MSFKENGNEYTVVISSLLHAELRYYRALHSFSVVKKKDNGSECTWAATLRRTPSLLSSWTRVIMQLDLCARKRLRPISGSNLSVAFHRLESRRAARIFDEIKFLAAPDEINKDRNTYVPLMLGNCLASFGIWYISALALRWNMWISGLCLPINSPGYFTIGSRHDREHSISKEWETRLCLFENGVMKNWTVYFWFLFPVHGDISLKLSLKVNQDIYISQKPILKPHWLATRRILALLEFTRDRKPSGVIICLLFKPLNWKNQSMLRRILPPGVAAYPRQGFRTRMILSA